MMNTPEAAVVIRELTVSRGGRQVLAIPELDVPTGSVTGLLGPSGCGKTTLMRSIVGVQRIRGSVVVLGHPAGTPLLRGRVGYVTQAPSVYTDLTAAENLRYFAAVLDVGKEAVARALVDVDLVDLADRQVERMSGGQRARVSLAAALLARPALLILDEPTVGLDPVLRRSLWALFARLAAAGTTLLVSSHVMDEAEQCDNLLLMREGAILAAGTPNELCERTGAATIGAAFLRLITGDPDAVGAGATTAGTGR